MANLSHLPDQWRRSGLSQRKSCERRGISLATFSYWRRKELHNGLPEVDAAPATPTFTEVIVAPTPDIAMTPQRGPVAPGVIEIAYADGTTVRIPVPAAAFAVSPCRLPHCRHRV